jgi:hypothetical protein
MNKTEVVKILAIADEVYNHQRKGNPEVIINVWYEIMQGEDYGLIGEALKRHIKDSKFYPTPADILEQAEKLKCVILENAMFEDGDYNSIPENMLPKSFKRGDAENQRFLSKLQGKLMLEGEDV